MDMTEICIHFRPADSIFFSHPSTFEATEEGEEGGLSGEAGCQHCWYYVDIVALLWSKSQKIPIPIVSNVLYFFSGTFCRFLVFNRLFHIDAFL